MKKSTQNYMSAPQGKLAIGIVFGVVILTYKAIAALAVRLGVSPLALEVILLVCASWCCYIAIASFKTGILYEASERGFTTRYTLYRLFDLYTLYYDWSEVYIVLADKWGCWLMLADTVQGIEGSAANYAGLLSTVRQFAVRRFDLPPLPHKLCSVDMVLSEDILLKIRIGLRAGLKREVTNMAKSELKLDLAAATKLIDEIAELDDVDR